MMAELLVGCPVRQRAGILPRWFEAVERSCANAGIHPTYVFAGDPEGDPETWEVIETFAAARHTRVEVEETPWSGERDWTTEGRVAHMVAVRNALLAEVRRLAPTWFLSLDSDVLAHPFVVRNLIQSATRFGAVGGRLYMTRSGTNDPSFANFGSWGGLGRLDVRGVHKIDVVMACVLMTPAAYAVDYEYHQWGEDIGHAQALRRAGVTVGADGRVANHHVIEMAMLDRPDERVHWPDAWACPLTEVGASTMIA